MNKKPIVIATVSEKGGVGKTTTTFNVAGALVVQGKKVCAIDFDPQKNLTQSFGWEPDGIKTIAELIRNEVDEFPNMTDDDYKKIIRKHPSGIDYIPATEKSLNQLSMLITEADTYAVKKSLESDIFKEYDFILIDCKNSFEKEYLTPYILAAADFVMTPCECGQYAYVGIPKILNEYNKIQERTNPMLKFLGILINKKSAHINTSRLVAEALEDGYKDYLFKTVIPYRYSQPEQAVAQHLPCVLAKKNTLKNDYLKLAKEIQERIIGVK